jgi:hypothetical protein
MWANSVCTLGGAALGFFFSAILPDQASRAHWQMIAALLFVLAAAGGGMPVGMEKTLSNA